jgi:IS30 family transposase
MSKKIQGNQKHLTLSDRIVIETSLEKRLSFKEIARFLSKDPTTISKEIKRHRVEKLSENYHGKNPCRFVQECKRFNVCSGHYCNVQCKLKKTCRCYLRCPFFERVVCPSLNAPPFVCNGCTKRMYCRQDKYYYRARNSYDDYKSTLSSVREGIHISREDLNEVDAFVSPLLMKGQPVAHIYSKFSDKLPFGSRTLYNYIDKGILSACNLDLPRKVKYKPRKSRKTRVSQDRAYRKGRTYSDFVNFLFENPETNVVEMDTVVGPSSGKTLLTMLFRSCSLMLAFIMPDSRATSVSAVFEALKASLGSDLFKLLFPVFLTDNGSEFFEWSTFLSDGQGEILSEIFYCDPNAAYQKGRLEKNHEFIRYICPKGTMFNPYSQQDITLMVNHINSIARASLNGCTPFELAVKLLDPKLFEVLGLESIEPSKVLLKPALLKR